MTRDNYWQYALGMIKVDGLEVSEEMLKMIKKEIKGEITTEDIKQWLDQKYKDKRK